MVPKRLTKEQKERLSLYADCADELAPPYVLTVDDLDPHFVKRARAASEEFFLSWPPTAAWEDEVRDAGLYQPELGSEDA